MARTEKKVSKKVKETKKSKQEDAPKKRGRPAKEEAAPAKKGKAVAEKAGKKKAAVEDAPKKRGRPAKAAAVEEAPKKRGRPAKEDPKAAAKNKRGAAEEKKSKKKQDEEDEDDAPAAKKGSKKNALTAAMAGVGFNPYANIDNELDRIDKDLALSGSSLNLNEQRMSTGLLGLDIVVGKGMVPGWYTVYGPEQSCKSTGAMAIMSSALMSAVPIKAYFDYEGSGEPTYIENMLKTNGIDCSIEEVFGLKDPRTSKWIKAPMIRYQKPQVAERFFDYVFKLEKQLPDKICIGDDWYYVYDDTKENRKIVGDQFDKNYWRSAKKLRVPAPDGTPQALIVVDSYPAMLPERLDDENAGSGMAAQARMFSEQIKRIKGRLAAKRIIIVGVNQLRQRPAVMYGCLHADTIVNFTDGRAIRMADVVDKKIRGKVWAINDMTGELEQKRIIDWHNNGNVEKKEDWIRVTARNPETRGSSVVTVTPDHKLYSGTGEWKEAKNYVVGDLLTSRIKSKINGTFEEFLTGLMIGGGTIVTETKNLGALKIDNSAMVAEYAAWKVGKMSSVMPFTESRQGAGFYLSERNEEFPIIRERFMANGAQGIKFTPLMLAALYMEAGEYVSDVKGAVFHLPRLVGDKKKLSAVVDGFKSLGFTGVVYADKGTIAVSVKNGFEKMAEIVAPFIPVCMRWKLPKTLWNLYKEFRLASKAGVKAVHVEITKIEVGVASLFRNKTKYDISIEDYANYMAGATDGGIIVHNSPEYEPCGDALKFYSDCRLRFNPRALSGVPYVSGKGMVLEEKSVTVKKGVDQYRYIHARATKNKLGMPYLETWIRLWIEDGNGDARGFDPVWDTFMYLDNTGQVSHKSLKKIMLKIKKHENAKPMDWMDFKTLIVGTKKQQKEVCERIGLKWFDLRAFCQDQLGNKDGMLLYIDYKKSGGEREDGDDEEESSSEDDAD